MAAQQASASGMVGVDKYQEIMSRIDIMHNPTEKQDSWDLEARLSKVEIVQEAMQGDIKEILRLMQLQTEHNEHFAHKLL